VLDWYGFSAVACLSAMDEVLSFASPFVAAAT